MKEDDENVRVRCEKPDPSKKLSKEKAKQILIQKIKMEFESEKKLSSLQIQSQQQAQVIVMVERTRVMDKLFIEHNVKLADLQRAIVEYDLENDNDVKSCKNLNLASREQIVKEKQEKMMEELKLQPDQMEEVKAVCAEIGDVDTSTDESGDARL